MSALPSSVSASPSHLLPQGEKGGLTAMPVGQPSPLAGEGARRADEGAWPVRRIESSARLKSFAKTLRRKQTEHEKRMWSVLRDRRFEGVKFRRQVPIGPYVADFACFEARLIVELDGLQHADNARDRVRDKWFEDDGYRVLRFWNGDVIRNRDAVGEVIWHALQIQQDPSSVSASPSHLLPQGEKGVPTAGVQI